MATADSLLELFQDFDYLLLGWMLNCGSTVIKLKKFFCVLSLTEVWIPGLPFIYSCISLLGFLMLLCKYDYFMCEYDCE